MAYLCYNLKSKAKLLYNLRRAKLCRIDGAPTSRPPQLLVQDRFGRGSQRMTSQDVVPRRSGYSVHACQIDVYRSTIGDAKMKYTATVYNVNLLDIQRRSMHLYVTPVTV